MCLLYELCMNAVYILHSFTNFAHTTLSLNKDLTYLFIYKQYNILDHKDIKTLGLSVYRL